MNKLKAFQLHGKSLAVSFIETMQVKEGVECDVYRFVEDSTKDLAIVRVQGGYKTPLQKVLKGEETIEGFHEGKATLTVTPLGSKPQVHSFDSIHDVGKEVIISVGQLVQWDADKDAGLIFYEVCTPPYEDGRFENLPE